MDSKKSWIISIGEVSCDAINIASKRSGFKNLLVFDDTSISKHNKILHTDYLSKLFQETEVKRSAKYFVKQQKKILQDFLNNQLEQYERPWFLFICSYLALALIDYSITKAAFQKWLQIHRPTHCLILGSQGPLVSRFLNDPRYATGFDNIRSKICSEVLKENNVKILPYNEQAISIKILNKYFKSISKLKSIYRLIKLFKNYFKRNNIYHKQNSIIFLVNNQRYLYLFGELMTKIFQRQSKIHLFFNSPSCDVISGGQNQISFLDGIRFFSASKIPMILRRYFVYLKKVKENSFILKDFICRGFSKEIIEYTKYEYLTCAIIDNSCCNFLTKLHPRVIVSTDDPGPYTFLLNKRAVEKSIPTISVQHGDFPDLHDVSLNCGTTSIRLLNNTEILKRYQNDDRKRKYKTKSFLFRPNITLNHNQNRQNKSIGLILTAYPLSDNINFCVSFITGLLKTKKPISELIAIRIHPLHEKFRNIYQSNLEKFKNIIRIERQEMPFKIFIEQQLLCINYGSSSSTDIFNAGIPGVFVPRSEFNFIGQEKTGIVTKNTPEKAAICALKLINNTYYYNKKIKEIIKRKNYYLNANKKLINSKAWKII